jgi:hypothetical protein
VLYQRYFVAIRAVLDILEPSRRHLDATCSTRGRDALKAVHKGQDGRVAENEPGRHRSCF